MRPIHPDMKVADLTVEQLAEVVHEVVGAALAEMLAGMASSLSDEDGELSEKRLHELEAEIMGEPDDEPPSDELTRRRQRR